MTNSTATKHDVSTRIAVLIFAATLCLSVAAIGSWLTATGVRDWYPSLNKPSWTPPNWLFGPVWTLLYLMMAVAAWLVWDRVGLFEARVPLGLFLIQLALNAVWSGLFFALQSPGLAFAEILLLWVAILATILSFSRVSRLAAGLLVPYLLWVTFAAALNRMIWVMNS